MHVCVYSIDMCILHDCVNIFSNNSCQYTGSSLPKCAFNGQQCCSLLTINLFGLGINTAVNDYAPRLVSGFATAQVATDELRNVTKGTNYFSV